MKKSKQPEITILESSCCLGILCYHVKLSLIGITKIFCLTTSNGVGKSTQTGTKPNSYTSTRQSCAFKY